VETFDPAFIFVTDLPPAAGALRRDGKDPRIGQRAYVVKGHFKGYWGEIRGVSPSGVELLLDARVTATVVVKEAYVVFG
jgi:hypothetical protein